MVNIGLVMSCKEPPDIMAKIAQEAEKFGFSHFFVADQDTYMSAYQTMAIMATVTEKIMIGTGATNPYTRHPVITAIEMLTLDISSKGRAFSSIGAGDYHFMKEIGLEWNRPALTIKEAILIIKQMLLKGSIKFEGKQFVIPGSKLRFKPVSDIPIFAAGRGPRIIKTSAEVADGILLDSIPLKAMKAVTEFIEEGSKRTQSSSKDFIVASITPLGIIKGKYNGFQGAKGSATWGIAFSYDFMMKPLGLTKEDVKPIFNALPNIKKAMALVTDDMVREYGIVGTPDECIQRIIEYEKAGLNLVVAGFPSGIPYMDTIRMIGNHIIPHLD